MLDLCRHATDGPSQHHPPVHHLQDVATRQMLQIGRSRLRLLIHSSAMSPSPLRNDLSSSESSSVGQSCLWNSVLHGYDRVHHNLGYLDIDTKGYHYA
jgi:hypothetical protein